MASSCSSPGHSLQSVAYSLLLGWDLLSPMESGSRWEDTWYQNILYIEKYVHVSAACSASVVLHQVHIMNKGCYTFGRNVWVVKITISRVGIWFLCLWNTPSWAVIIRALSCFADSPSFYACFNVCWSDWFHTRLCGTRPVPNTRTNQLGKCQCEWLYTSSPFCYSNEWSCLYSL